MAERWLLLALVLGCGSHRAPPPPVSVPPSPSPVAGEMILLDVPGYRPAVVWIPAGTTADVKPAILATHGAYDNPENYCPFWRTIVHDRAFVVCTRGLRISDSEFYYPHHFFIDEEGRAALEALRARVGARLAGGSVLYAGYSQGAIHGAPLLQMRPGSYHAAVLIEGGAAWSQAAAARYRESGGGRVLLVCGTSGCLAAARTALRTLSDAGVPARLEWVPGAGHDYPRATARRIGEQFPWLVGDDPRWSSR